MGKSMRGWLQEYLAVKAQHRDAVLFWRMGDFYEMYFDHAAVAAKTLGISCTIRDGCPMAGVPCHSVSAFLARMIRAGYRVAVCEPQELHGRQGGTKYEVVRVVSPGLAGAREEATPPLPETEEEDGFDRMHRELREMVADMQELKKAARKLYEERTGQKWQPSLSVVQGGGKRRKKKARRPAMTLLDGGRG